jgi:hypothetical protein
MSDPHDLHNPEGLHAPDGSSDGGGGLVAVLLSGLSACTAEAVDAVTALVALAEQPEPDGQWAAAAVADDLVLLARAAHLLEAETGRREPVKCFV